MMYQISRAAAGRFGFSRVTWHTAAPSESRERERRDRVWVGRALALAGYIWLAAIITFSLIQVITLIISAGYITRLALVIHTYTPSRTRDCGSDKSLATLVAAAAGDAHALSHPAHVCRSVAFVAFYLLFFSPPISLRFVCVVWSEPTSEGSDNCEASPIWCWGSANSATWAHSIAAGEMETFGRR